jgi:hypothetical protein
LVCFDNGSYEQGKHYTKQVCRAQEIESKPKNSLI